MPLTFTGAQRTLLAAAAHRLWVKVEVEDPGGGFVDLTSWFLSATWADSIDNPAMEGSCAFARDDVGTSLAPLMTGSPMNQYAAAYAAALEGERLIKISQVITTPTGVPAPTDYLETFRGYLDAPRFGGRDQNEVSCTMRDIGGLLMDQWTEKEALYPAASIETTLQAILTANPNWKLGTITLNVPVSPGVNLSAFTLPIKPVLLALRDIADQIGWTVKYQRDASNNFLLTLFQPQRSKTVADYSLGPNEYDDVAEFEIPTNDVRNIIEIGYIDAGTGASKTYRTTDAASIAKYGKRFMRIQEDPTTNIDTLPEATKMGDAALADLRRPYATQQVSVPALFWIVQCGDLIAFPSNGVLYDTTQNMGVTGYTHTISDGEGTTTIDTREQVAGGVTTWIAKGDIPPAAQQIIALATSFTDFWTAPPGTPTKVPGVFAAVQSNEAVRSVRFDLSDNADFVPVLGTKAVDITLRQATTLFQLTDADRDKIWYVRATPFSGALSAPITGSPTGIAGLSTSSSTLVAPTLQDSDTTVINRDVPGVVKVDLLGGGGAAFVTLASSSTITWPTAGARNNDAKVTLGVNATLVITGAVDGAQGYLEVTQDSTGGRTLALPSGRVVGSVTDINPTANKQTSIGWVYNGAAFTFILAPEN